MARGLHILVTGGVGFIGSNLVQRLVSDGHDVHSIDNYSTGTSTNEVDGCRYSHVDCIDICTALENERYDVIFHLAALARIAPSFNNPTATFDVNVIGTQRVLEYARITGAKVVYAGSSSRWHNPESSPYATSKYIGEQLCKMYRNSFAVPIQMARFYNVYGPNEIVDGDYATVIGIWRRQIRNGEPVTIIGDGEQRRDFTHVSDIVDGLVRIMHTNHYHDDAWELGTGVNYSVNEMFWWFHQRFGCASISLPDRPGNYRSTRRVHSDALNLLDWSPTDQLEHYIAELH